MRSAWRAARRLSAALVLPLVFLAAQDVFAQGSAPTVTALEIISTPNADVNDDGIPETYGLAEEIKIQVTFSEAVVVTGAPRLRVDLTSRQEWAWYSTGSGSTKLTFIWAVRVSDLAPAGVAVLANTLELNLGTIVAQADSSINANLAHSGLAKDPAHKADGRLDTAPPGPQSARVDGRRVEVIFTEFLDTTSKPAGSAFTVTATPEGGTARSISGTGTAAVVGGTATVILAGSVAPGEALTLAYAKPASGPLRDAAENEVADFSGQETTNITPAGPAYTLVRNTAQSVDSGFILFSGTLAQGFTTGSQTDGYRLTSAEIYLKNVGSSPPSYSVKILHPTQAEIFTIGTLENPSTLVGGRNTFTAPGEGFHLSPSTEYFVIFEPASADFNWFDYEIDLAGSDDEDPGAAAGWSVGNEYWVRAFGGSWAVSAPYDAANNLHYSALISINGHEERSTTLVANTGQTGATASNDANFSNDHAQPFTTGSNSGGYRVTAVQVETAIGSPSMSTAPTYEVSIRSDSSGDPGDQPGHARKAGQFGPGGQHVHGLRAGHQAGHLRDVLPADGRERGGEPGRQGRTHVHERRGFGRGDGLEHREHLPAERERGHRLDQCHRRHQRGADRRARPWHRAEFHERKGGRDTAGGDLRREPGREHDARHGVRHHCHQARRHGTRHRRHRQRDDLRGQGDRDAGTAGGPGRDADAALHPAGRRRAGRRQQRLGGRLLRPADEQRQGGEAVCDGGGDHLDPAHRFGQ